MRHGQNCVTSWEPRRNHADLRGGGQRVFAKISHSVGRTWKAARLIIYSGEDFFFIPPIEWRYHQHAVVGLSLVCLALMARDGKPDHVYFRTVSSLPMHHHSYEWWCIWRDETPGRIALESLQWQRNTHRNKVWKFQLQHFSKIRVSRWNVISHTNPYKI